MAATLGGPSLINSCRWDERRQVYPTQAAKTNPSAGTSRDDSAQIRKFATGGMCASDATLKASFSTCFCLQSKLN